MSTRPRPDLADIVHELTTEHRHRQHYQVPKPNRDGTTTWHGRNHTTIVPALLEQLWHADTPSTAAEDGPRAGYTSKPAARLEALDCLHHIDRDTTWWIHHLGRTRDGRGLAAAVRLVHSLHPGLDACDHRRAGCCDAHELEHAIRSWWTQARIVTGWDSPAWKPDNTCPMCSERGTLRVKLADQAAFCAECRETWEPGTIGLLADHIRAESDAERRPRLTRPACACPWPKPIVPDLSRLCPWCGSARCVHALERVVDTPERDRSA